MKSTLLALASTFYFCTGELTFSPDNSFDYNLITTVLQDEKDNVVMSSLSIKLLLAIFRHSINGPAEAELKNILLPSVKDRHVSLYFADILEKLQVKTQANGLGIRQDIFINSDYVTGIRESFEKACLHYYDTNILKTPIGQSGLSADKINQYFAVTTKGQITAVVTQGSIENAAILMINAIYFKGVWEYAFEKLASTKLNFFKYGTEPVKTQFMTQTNIFKTARFEKYSVLDLPYKGGNISMLIILPSEGVQLSDVINSSTLKNLVEDETLLSEKEINILIPKFSLNNKIKLPDVLRKMGINTLFNGDYEIYEFLPKGLVVSDIIQKVKIAVDEEGTKASAISILDVVPLIGDGPPRFYVNKPFVYLVVEKSTKSVLFSGKVVNPTKNV